MATHSRHGFEYVGANLVGDGSKLIGWKSAQVGWRVNTLEKRHRGRIVLQSVAFYSGPSPGTSWCKVVYRARDVNLFLTQRRKGAKTRRRTKFFFASLRLCAFASRIFLYSARRSRSTAISGRTPNR